MLWAQSIVVIFILLGLWEALKSTPKNVVYWFLLVALLYFAGTFNQLVPYVTGLF